MPKEHKPRLKGAAKQITRAQANRLLSNGADPNDARFVSHPNYHIRKRSWVARGKPLPEDPTERSKFLTSIRVKEIKEEVSTETQEPS